MKLTLEVALWESGQRLLGGAAREEHKRGQAGGGGGGGSGAVRGVGRGGQAPLLHLGGVYQSSAEVGLFSPMFVLYGLRDLRLI